MKNKLYLERIIKKALMEQNEPGGPPPVNSGTPPPVSSTPEASYYVSIGGKDSDQKQYTPTQMKSMNLSGEDKVWKTGYSDWKPIKDVPELSSVISASPDKQAPPQQNTTTQTTEEKQVESFFSYCPTTKGLLDQAAKKILELTNRDINSAATVEEAEEIRNNAFVKMGEDNKKNLNFCKGELRGSGRGDIQQILAKFEPAIKTLLNKTAADLGKKALSGGVNLLVGLVTKKLGGGSLTQSSVSNAVSESLIKKNTKNNLIEIYNKKNRRRY